MTIRKEDPFPNMRSPVKPAGLTSAGIVPSNHALVRSLPDRSVDAVGACLQAIHPLPFSTARATEEGSQASSREQLRGLGSAIAGVLGRGCRIVVWGGLMVAGSLAPAAAAPDLDSQIQHFVDRSLPRLGANLSVGAPGSIVAAPSRKDPNYYFHWNRDSALVVDALVRLLPYLGDLNRRPVQQFIESYVRFSAHLQELPSAYGLSDTRFTVEGGLDTSKWARPQQDGPALRALALLRYRSAAHAPLSSDIPSLLRTVIERDLDEVARVYRQPCYDLWEFSYGFHFYTRVVQLGALEAGSRAWGAEAHPLWADAAQELRRQLPAHWNAAQNIYTFSEGPTVDEDRNLVRPPGGGLDSSAVLAVNHGRVAGPRFSNRDERLWSTLDKLEAIFRVSFPLNQRYPRGPAIGRHEGDGYYGGNAFFFLIAGYAEHYFRLAEFARGTPGTMEVTALRAPTLTEVLDRPVEVGTVIHLPDAPLADAFARKGEAFLRTMLDQIPEDGMMAEQFDKVTGQPRSARDLTWSYASLLTAILQREEWRRSSVDFSRVSLFRASDRTSFSPAGPSR